MMEVFGKMIKKFVNDDIVFFDYEEIVEKIRKELEKKNFLIENIEKEFVKIPDEYYLILNNKL